MNIQEFYPIFLQAKNIVIDSRLVTEGDLFFAFSGDTYNAAECAPDAITNGAIAVIVEQNEFENRIDNIFAVPSTLEFLQKLALYHRSQLNIPLIGLTGSNGKTTTKELMHAVLSKKFNVQYTKGNLNNHIGVPLTLLSIKPEHELAIVEMGANHQKEIAQLSDLARPTIGYITNFGKAHLEGFGGVEGVVKGKSELYDFLRKSAGTVVVNECDEIQKNKTADFTDRITFGTKSSDYDFSVAQAGDFVGLTYRDVTAISNLTGTYNFTNLGAAAALGLHFDIVFSDIANAIGEYQPTNMRSQIVVKDGKKLVLDTYNANPSSMAAALRNLSGFEGNKTVILGDMLELGAESEKEHLDILDLAKDLQFEEVITVGPHFKNVNPAGRSFREVNELVEYLKQNPLQSAVILLKGSRGIALEKAQDYI